MQLEGAAPTVRNADAATPTDAAVYRPTYPPDFKIINFGFVFKRPVIKSSSYNHQINRATQTLK